MCALAINSEKFPGLQLGIRAPACAMRGISQVCCEGLHPSAFKGLATRNTVEPESNHHYSISLLPIVSCTLSGCCAWARCLLPTSASPCDTTHTPHNNPHERSTAARIAWSQGKMDALGDRCTLGFTSSVLKTPDRLPRQGVASKQTNKQKTPQEFLVTLPSSWIAWCYSGTAVRRSYRERGGCVQPQLPQHRPDSAGVHMNQEG